MHDQESSSILAQIPDLAGLPPGQMNALAAVCRLQTLDENSILYQENEKSADVFYLVSGLVEARVRIPTREADECLRTHKPGRVFGETAFLDGGRRGTTSLVRERSIVLRFDGGALHAVCDQDAAIGICIYRWLAHYAAEHSRDASIELRNALGNF
ncbi:MAG: cyclic nucleotide-binding domain-containing protein [Spirochaetes bacterium]|nr:cyclic nucleotide-binding domain-containing protein [Spirochaetota bacterium]MBU0955507.1 cyclic nucleotide-binding domain-containing protein [Spirochaetota bacterium]